MARDDYLFSGVDWFSVEEHQKNQLQNDVASYDDNRLLNTSVDDLCDYFAEKYRVNVPVLQRDAIVADQREAEVDVTHRFDYISHRPGPHLVPGTTVEITIPFTGDEQAFTIRPTTYSMNPPRATLRGDSVVVEITGIDMSADKVRSEIDSAIASIEGYLENLRKERLYRRYWGLLVTG